MKSGVGFNVYFDYTQLKWPIHKISVGYYKADAGPAILFEGDYSLLWIEESILVSPQARVPSVPFYAGGGVGYYIPNYGLNPRIQNKWAEFGKKLRRKLAINGVYT